MIKDNRDLSFITIHSIDSNDKKILLLKLLKSIFSLSTQEAMIHVKNIFEDIPTQIYISTNKEGFDCAIDRLLSLGCSISDYKMSENDDELDEESKKLEQSIFDNIEDYFLERVGNTYLLVEESTNQVIINDSPQSEFFKQKLRKKGIRIKEKGVPPQKPTD